MKSRIFLYLFLFAALLALFQYVTGNNMQKALSSDVEQLKNEVTTLEDSLQTMHLKVLDMQYFTGNLG